MKIGWYISSPLCKPRLVVQEVYMKHEVKLEKTDEDYHGGFRDHFLVARGVKAPGSKEIL